MSARLLPGFVQCGLHFCRKLAGWPSFLQLLGKNANSSPWPERPGRRALGQPCSSPHTCQPPCSPPSPRVPAPLVLESANPRDSVPGTLSVWKVLPKTGAFSTFKSQLKCHLLEASLGTTPAPVSLTPKACGNASHCLLVPPSLSLCGIISSVYLLMVCSPLPIPPYNGTLTKVRCYLYLPFYS